MYRHNYSEKFEVINNEEELDATILNNRYLFFQITGISDWAGLHAIFNENITDLEKNLLGKNIKIVPIKIRSEIFIVHLKVEWPV